MQLLGIGKLVFHKETKQKTDPPVIYFSYLSSKARAVLSPIWIMPLSVNAFTTPIPGTPHALGRHAQLLLVCPPPYMFNLFPAFQFLLGRYSLQYCHRF